MIAKMKCSNCGAEMSNLNLSWGRKTWLIWLFTLPVILLGLFPIIKITFFKGDPGKELVISEVQQRHVNQTIEVLGLITNTGSHRWSNVTIKAEFFDSNGTFVDEQTEYLRSEFAAGSQDHFKISVHSLDDRVTSAKARMELKITGGMTMPF